MKLLQAVQQRQAVGFHGTGVTSCEYSHLIGGCIHPCLQSLLGFLHLQEKSRGKSLYFGPDVSKLRLPHLLQRGLQATQVGPQVPADQLPDAVPMAMDHVARGAAVVVAVQRGGTVQTHGQVTWLAEEPELLARVEGAEDGPAEATAGLQLFEAANGVRRRPLLPPGEAEETSEQTLDWSQWSPVLRLPRARSKEGFPHSPEFGDQTSTRVLYVQRACLLVNITS